MRRRPRRTKIAASKTAHHIGVTKDSIKMGTISMHGMALGNVLITPLVNGIGDLRVDQRPGRDPGRRMTLIDCDDGPGEVSRTKACIKKLAGVDKVFALLTSPPGQRLVHDDLKQFQLPSFGEWPTRRPSGRTRNVPHAHVDDPRGHVGCELGEERDPAQTTP